MGFLLSPTIQTCHSTAVEKSSCSCGTVWSYPRAKLVPPRVSMLHKHEKPAPRTFTGNPGPVLPRKGHNCDRA
jgi:hypothetical protein